MRHHARRSPSPASAPISGSEHRRLEYTIVVRPENTKGCVRDVHGRCCRPLQLMDRVSYERSEERAQCKPNGPDSP